MMLNKIKKLLQRNKNSKRFFEANEYGTVVPFLFGAQIENRKLGRYIFVKDDDNTEQLLSDRDFTNITTEDKYFKSNILETDSLLSIIAESLMYNKEFNIILSLIHIDNWDTLNTCINIAEATSEDFDTKVKITINSLCELLSSEEES